MNDKTLKIENVRVLRGGQLISTYLWIENGKIIDPQARFWRSETKVEYGPGIVIDGKGMIVTPGYIDVQLNGAYGHDFSDIAVTTEQIDEVRQRLLATGVTAFCPTVISSVKETYKQVLHKFKRTNDGHIRKAANMLGLHLEGPFINKQRKGAHKEEVLRDPVDGIKTLEDVYGSFDNVAIITIAPELKGSLESISELSKRGIIVSAGHSSAHIQEGIKGIEAGATMLT